MPATYWLFYLILGLGTTIVCFSSNWLFSWIGLEMNSFAFIPLMMQNNHPRSTEAATKYFIIQSCASALLLFAAIFNAWVLSKWNIPFMRNEIALTITTVALATKLGVAPFHLWLPEVMQGLNFKMGLILATWQKLAPLMILTQISHAVQPPFLTVTAILSSILAGWAGMNQTQVRKILAYSSTANLGWMIIIIQYKPSLTLLTLLVYIISTTTTFLLLKESLSMKINALALSWSKSTAMAVILALAFLSMAGLPPLTGFLPKWLILQEMIKQHMTLPATLITISTLISLYFYVRLCYFIIITLFPGVSKMKFSWRRKSKQNKIILATAATIATVFLPLAPLLYALVNCSI
uniref:NADH-ubiquinone oxidoreductase chain 2 n=1 Tax=Thayeria boehlkei TaxID=681901 RepID=A0A7U0FNV6_9TELE|nr:NADH dehydrogenase subunit 2 [Thayeria boehlkei]QQV68807.1 NADH dehydrogenase subunit 2 [Thayeria boehlkei]